MLLTVVDASVVVEAITSGKLAAIIRSELTANAATLIAPHLVDVEVISALRRLIASGQYSQGEAKAFISDLESFPMTRYPHKDLLPRVWELRHNFTAYDAMYIALAEAMDAILFTTDLKLKRGHRARVKVFAEWQQ